MHTRYTKEHLDLALLYIRDHAPMIIHIHLDPILQYLISDSHYRNQFETKTSNGTLDNNIRRQWESRMFGGAYNHSSVTGFDRVKYGVFNIFNCPDGVPTCCHYGDSYLMLKNEVRLRTTCADKDTACDDANLTTCQHYAHLLNNSGDVEGVIEAALDFYSLPSPEPANKARRPYYGPYKEIQIHGPVCLKHDISKLVVNVKHRGDRAMMAKVEKFCAQNGVVYGFTDGTGPAFKKQPPAVPNPPSLEKVWEDHCECYHPKSSFLRRNLLLFIFLLLFFVFIYIFLMDTSPVVFLL